jgi:DNA-binding XRE family transcriptional regulator
MAAEKKAVSEHDLEQLAKRLEALLDELRSNWSKFAPHLSHLPPASRKSAENLIHYVTLRRNDIRELQQDLARNGLSSLGRAESHVMSSIIAVVNLLHMLLNRRGIEMDSLKPISFDEGRDLLVAFGRAVRRLRSEQGYSQEAFADVVGIHRTYIGDIERGKRNVSLRNVDRIAIALDVSLAELMSAVIEERAG